MNKLVLSDLYTVREATENIYQREREIKNEKQGRYDKDEQK